MRLPGLQGLPFREPRQPQPRPAAGEAALKVVEPSRLWPLRVPEGDVGETLTAVVVEVPRLASATARQQGPALASWQ